jgi:hypothetical protein
MMTWEVVWFTESDGFPHMRVCNTWAEAFGLFAGLVAPQDYDVLSCVVTVLLDGKPLAHNGGVVLQFEA